MQSDSKSSYTDAEREQFLRLWRQSGMNQSTFCKQHNISPKTFGNWVRKKPSQAIKMLPVGAEAAINTSQSKQVAELVFPSGVRCQINFTDYHDVVNLIKEYEQCS